MRQALGSAMLLFFGSLCIYFAATPEAPDAAWAAAAAGGDAQRSSHGAAPEFSLLGAVAVAPALDEPAADVAPALTLSRSRASHDRRHERDHANRSRGDDGDDGGGGGDDGGGDGDDDDGAVSTSTRLYLYKVRH